ncbi:MAG: cupin-like domain-containing protein [Steroidobacteraceae bacterium]
MTSNLQRIPEWHDVDAEVFRSEILTQYRPAVLRGLVRHWPAVREALASPEAICRYLCSLDNGNTWNAVLLPPQWQGRMFYEEDLKDFNFVRDKLPVSAVLGQIARYSHFAAPPSVAMQCAPIAECIPGFVAANTLPILSETVRPKLWLSNRFITPAHFDEMNNIACVVAGRRRFTLFPPEQISNLYIGPLEYTPAGAPISMVSLENPDFQRFPRFREALAAAQVAELEPGDAIFIPALWWHHVVSLDVVNILVNYWWQEPASTATRISPVHSLMHSLLSIRHLPPEQRQAWGRIFAYFLFDPQQDPVGHIPEHRRGVLGPLSKEQADAIRQMINLRQD